MTSFQKYRGRIAFLTGLLVALAIGWRGFPLVLFERRLQPVAFSHKIHSGQAGAKCEDCHSLRDDGSFAGVPALDKCSACHAQPMGSSAEEKRFIDRYVAHNREIPWQVNSRQPQNVYFSHAAHVKLAHVDCKTCHGLEGQSETLGPVRVDRISGYSGSPAFQTMDDCEDCHRRRGAANSCLDCHK